MDESSVVRVLEELSAINLPDAIFDYLCRHGATEDQVGTIHIGIKRVATAMIPQHCGLLDYKDDSKDD